MARPRPSAVAALLVVLLGLLAGCTAAPVTTPGTAAPPAATAPGPAAAASPGALVADGAVVSLGPWSPCGQAARCASVSVPLDWDDPAGDRVSVGISLLPAADPAQRLGAVLYAPGGPGVPGAAVVADSDRDAFPGELADRFDLVGLDQRGTGSSEPLVRCPTPVDDPAVPLTPTDQAGFDALVAHGRAVSQGCLAATGPLLAHVDTVSAAHDVEAVRVVLGLGTVDFLGLSYGTLLGATYASLHPDRVGSMVLDGPVDRDAGAAGLTDAEDVATQAALGRWADWCAAAQECALTGGDGTGEDVLGVYRDLLDRATAAPLPAAADPGGVTAEQLGRSVFGYLQDPDGWPDLAEAVADAAAGDASGFAASPEPVDELPEDQAPDDELVPVAAPATAEAAYRAITCLDFPTDLTDLAGLRARLADLTAAAPDVRGMVEGWGLEAGCLGWSPTTTARPGPTPVAGLAPVLVVGGRFDPTTPAPLGVGVAGQLLGAVLLPTTLDGHTASLSGDPCAAAAIRAHLVDPRTTPPATCGPG